MVNRTKRKRSRVRSRSKNNRQQPSFSGRVRDAHGRLSEADTERKAGNIAKAIKLCETLIDQYPDYVGALHILGLAHMAQRAYWPALSCFVRAAMLNPQDWTILTSLAQAYLGLEANEMAARTLELARAINGDDVEVHYTLGLIYDRQREYEAASAAFNRAMELDPGHALAAFSCGLCATHLGDLEMAAKAFLASHDADPNLIAPITATAQLPAALSRFDVESALSKVAQTSAKSEKDHKIHVAFTRAHILHGKCEHESAWAELKRANDPLASRYSQDLARHRERREAITIRAKAYRAPKTLPVATAGEIPVSLFILGISRSGKTTLERLLDRIPGIKRGYENPIVEIAVSRTSQEAGLLTMNQLGDLPADLGGKFALHYTNNLRIRAKSADVFTNTNPGRVADVGRLAELIPNVRFVFITRNRADTALRIYLKHFREGGNAYAYDLDSIFAEIDWYHDMFAIWQERLGDICLCVTYEEMIADPAGQVARVAAHCGLRITPGEMPAIGDDRGCAEPYSALMAR